MEKVYDAGRYMFLCCSGEAMPNLYGIWTGVWSPEWSGDYTTDANLHVPSRRASAAIRPN